MANDNTYYTITIADDEPSILSSLKELPLWNELNIKVIGTANEGKKALENIISLKPDFALLDIKMPNLSGLDVLKECTRVGVQTQIIIISGFDEFSYAKEAIKYGAKAYLLKPINYLELDEELGILISKLNDNRKALNPKRPTTFFKDLLEGRIIDSSLIPRMLSSIDDKVTDTSLFVMNILFLRDLNNTDWEKIIPLFRSAFSDERHKEWFQDKKNLVAIINETDRTPFEIASSVLKIFDIEGFSGVRISIGDVVPGLYQSSLSYSKALLALTYRIYAPERRIFTSLDICTTAPNGESPFENIDLVTPIVQNDKSKIEAVVKDFIQRLLYVPMPSPNYVFAMSHSLCVNVVALLKTLLPESFVSNSFEEIPLCESLNSLLDYLVSFFWEVSTYITKVYGTVKAEFLLAEANGELQEDELIRKAKLFIKENIERSVQIADVADFVALSPTYFAMYFKSKTGETLRDYLLKEKMEWASRALLDKNANVEDISSRLGYSDYHAFSRAFKKIYKDTPSGFRNKVLKK